MPNQLRCAARTLWPIGLAAIVLWTAPENVWGQGASVSSQAHANTDQPFATLNDSVTRAADALLVSGNLPAGDVPTQTRVVEATTDNHPIHFDHRPWSWVGGGPGTAAARLDLLRPVIEPILRGQGVPTDLAAVILVESGGRANALSPKGARGLWQLMPETARRYGLRVDDIKDDRLDVEKSTRAAARYLSDLHLQFGAWALALAAYNTGEQNVQRAISRSGSREFTVLSSLGLLPFETGRYVPSVMAIIQSRERPSPVAEYHRVLSKTIIFAASNY